MASKAHKRKNITAPANLVGVAWSRTDLGVGGAIFILAFAVRLLYLFQIESMPVFYHLPGDPLAYDQWAQRLAGGDWIGQSVFYQAPLYPYFLAVLELILGHDLWSIRVAQIILSAAACGLLYLAGKRFFSRPTGIVAGLILCFNAPAIFFGSVIDKTVTDLFLVVVLLVVLSSAALHKQSKTFLAVGITLGLLALSRENTLIWAAVIPAWIWHYFAPSRVSGAANGSAFFSPAWRWFCSLSDCAISRLGASLL